MLEQLSIYRRPPTEHHDVTPSTWALLSRLPRLQRMTVLDATDSDLRGIAQLLRLDDLVLDFWEVSQAGLEHLSCLTALRKLDVSGHKRTGHPLPFIKCLISLRELIVSD